MLKSAYLSLLASSVIAIVLSDAVIGQHNLLVNAALVFGLPSSVGISMWLLRRRCKKVTASPLPLWSLKSGAAVGEHGTECSLEQFVIPLAFGHAWLMLSRFLGVVSGVCSVPPNSSFGSHWTPIGLPLTLLSAAVFGKCLLILSIQKEHWGFFLLPYHTITFFLEATIYILQNAIDLFAAGSVAMETFRRKWGGGD
ncbi:hypothetical protein BT96DRAFT_1017982 [Gymnopus androsaceus JB14]|uniref:Uncharacterized protein n=1 Tax=Gymnopus androsaceus JB14 TaxID=1447944 RepID=A0A6A4HXS7_9AGAR|nr:hypothetical protein BT96DRAFT_1017982 [Gymnopus androsaceus JB14]